MSKTYTVTVSGYVRHNGVRYEPGGEITGLTASEVEHLKRARVVSDVVEDEPPPPASLVDQVLDSNAKDAVAIIASAEDVDALTELLEKDKRTTVLEAIEKRLGEFGTLTPADPDQTASTDE